MKNKKKYKLQYEEISKIQKNNIRNQFTNPKIHKT